MLHFHGRPCAAPALSRPRRAGPCPPSPAAPPGPAGYCALPYGRPCNWRPSAHNPRAASPAPPADHPHSGRSINHRRHAGVRRLPHAGGPRCHLGWQGAGLSGLPGWLVPDGRFVRPASAARRRRAARPSLVARSLRPLPGLCGAPHPCALGQAGAGPCRLQQVLSPVLGRLPLQGCHRPRDDHHAPQ